MGKTTLASINTSNSAKKHFAFAINFLVALLMTLTTAIAQVGEQTEALLASNNVENNDYRVISSNELYAYNCAPNYNEVLVVFNDVNVSRTQATSFVKRYPKMRVNNEIPVFKPINGVLFNLNSSDKASFEKQKEDLMASVDVLSVYPSLVLKGGTKAFAGNTIVVTTSSSDINITSALVNKGRISESYLLGDIMFYSITVDKGIDVFHYSQYLTKISGVLNAQPDFITVESSNLMTSDTYYNSQWLIEKIDADLAWNTTDGMGGVAAVLDGGGFDVNHPDMINKITAPYNAVDDNSNLTPENSNAKHGTPCMSLVAAETDNNEGVASTGNKVMVVPIRIGYNQQTDGTFNTSATILARAANHVVTLGTVSAVSNSYSSSSYNSSRKVAYDHMRVNSRNGLGAVVLASMGNNGNNNHETYPAWYDGVIGVGSTTQSDDRANSSNYGDNIDVSAPGVSTYTADRQGSEGYDNGDYESSFSGTSAACPVAAAVVALVASLDPSLTGLELANILEQSCEKVGGYSYNTTGGRPNGTWDHRLGYGRVNANIAVGLVNGGGGNCDVAYNGQLVKDGVNGGAGNSDGQANPDEEIDLELALEAIGCDLTNVSGILTTSDSDINVTDDYQSWGDINDGQIVWTSDYDFDVDPNTPDKDVIFNLAVTSDQGSWDITFVVHIYAGGGGGNCDVAYNGQLVKDGVNGGVGNSDGQANPDEEIDLELALEAIGCDLTNVSGILTTSDSDITITDDYQSWGSINDGQIVWTSDYDFDVDLNTPDKDVIFNLAVTSDQGSWDITFVVHIYAGGGGNCDVAYNGQLVKDGVNGGVGNSDGQANPDEEIDLELALEAIGCDLTNVSGILTTSDSDINVTDDYQSWGDINDGQIVWTSDYDFDVDPNTPDKDVIFNLAVTSDQGSWDITFVVHIYAGGGGGNCDVAYNGQLVKDGVNGGVGNSDGQANPDEEIDLELALEAIGCDLTNVSGILTTSDSDITITDDYQSWGSINDGQIVWTSDYDFDVDLNTPDKDVIFNLAVTSDQGSWDITFVVHIYAGGGGNCDVAYNGQLVKDGVNGGVGNSDGQANPDEEIDLELALEAIGCDLTNVSGILATSDSDINVTDDYQSWGDINDGQIVWTSDYDFDVDPNTPDKDVIFNLAVTSDQGSWDITFVVHIYAGGGGNCDVAYNGQLVKDGVNGGVGNSDGQANPDEEIDLELALEAIGCDLTNVSGILTTSDSDINVTDDYQSWGDINDGQIVWTSDYDFDVDPNTPDKDVIFNLAVTSDQGSWDITFVVHIYAGGGGGNCDVAYNGQLVKDGVNGGVGNSDGQANPDEEIDLELALEAIGCDLTNVSGILTTSDSDINVTDDYQSWGDINDGQIVWTSDYDFDVDPNTPDKDVIFNLAVTSDQGSWNISFVVHIYSTALSTTEHNLENQVSIFPNPADDYISVESSLQSDIYLSVYDLHGRNVTNTIIINRLSRIQINTGNLASATYLVKIQDLVSGKIVVKRLIVSH